MPVILHKILENMADVLSNTDKKQKNDDLYNKLNTISNKNKLFYVFIILFIFYSVNNSNINVSHIFALLLSVGIIYIIILHDKYNVDDYIQTYDDKLVILNNIINDSNYCETVKQSNDLFNDIVIGKKSYLYINPTIIDLYFDNLIFAQKNYREYQRSLINMNNILHSLFIITDNDIDSECMTRLIDNVIDYKNETLNAFANIIYGISDNTSLYNKHNESSKKLKNIIENTYEIIKNKYKVQWIHDGKPITDETKFIDQYNSTDYVKPFDEDVNKKYDFYM